MTATAPTTARQRTSRPRPNPVRLRQLVIDHFATATDAMPDDLPDELLDALWEIGFEPEEFIARRKWYRQRLGDVEVIRRSNEAKQQLAELIREIQADEGWPRPELVTLTLHCRKLEMALRPPQLQDKYRRIPELQGKAAAGPKAKQRLLNSAPEWIDEAIKPLAQECRTLHTKLEKIKEHAYALRYDAKKSKAAAVRLKSVEAEKQALEDKFNRLASERNRLSELKLEAWACPPE